MCQLSAGFKHTSVFCAGVLNQNIVKDSNSDNGEKQLMKDKGLKITPRSEDFSGWYNQLVQVAELADYAPVKGCMVIRPYGYALWNAVKQELDNRIKATGCQEAYFPLLIPKSFLEKEAEHVEGFSPELAVVTHGGGKELEEPLVIRPTSEAVIGVMYSKWIQSYRDLPLRINQWANVVRWEKRPRLFLRTLEFLWQEGHTAHETYDEAQQEVMRILYDVYLDFSVNAAAIPSIAGRKSESEKFAGALASYSLEAMMGNKWALQAATSHNLGQNFAKAFDIKFTDEENNLQHCWTTSWGMASRMIGAIIMVHGDDQGLILPPRLAPYQIVIVPIWRDETQKTLVLENVESIKKQLSPQFRVHVDTRDNLTPGWKFNEWELKGVPLRIEIGPKDIEKNQVVLARRDILGRAGKIHTSLDNGLVTKIAQLLNDIQDSLLTKARQFREDNTHRPKDYDHLAEIVTEGWAFAWWCGNKACEMKIKEDTKATSRCIPLEQDTSETGYCIVCGEQAKERTIFARAF
jgi:prolyl-tRNA synthetase